MGCPKAGLCLPLQALLSMLTLSEVVMPSMPSPSSCVKNWDATLRRVTLSPPLPAMAAGQFSLEKRRADEALSACGGAGPSSHHPQRAQPSPPAGPVSVGSSEPSPSSRACLRLCLYMEVVIWGRYVSQVRGSTSCNTKPHLQYLRRSGLTTNTC